MADAVTVLKAVPLLAKEAVAALAYITATIVNTLSLLQCMLQLL
jgi:hypothetical protein